METIVVYGPQGCGKTRNANRIREHFGLALIVDGWDGNSTLRRGTLALTNVAPPYRLKVRAIAYADLPAGVRI